MTRLALAAVALCCSAAASAFDLQVSSFTDTPDPAVAGGQYTYSVGVTNSAVVPAPASELTVTLDANLNVSGALPAGCLFEPAPRLVRCAIPALGFGEATTRAFAVRYVAPGVVVVSSTAEISNPGAGDTSIGNNTSTQNTTINQGADLALTKSATSPVAQGGQVTFTIGVTNNGPNIAAGGIRVLDTLPGSLTFVSGSGAGWNCSAVGQNVTCTNPADIAVSAAASTLQIVAQLAPGIATGVVTNAATTDLLNPLIGDGEPGNNTNTGSFTVVPGADLSVGKSVAPNPVVSGAVATFTLTPRNNAGSTASTVTVTDTLPAGFTGIAANGTGWACNVAGQTVTCIRATYAVGATDNVTITATAPVVGTLQPFSNTASINSATPDTNPGNNTSPVVNFNVQPDGADLTLAKSKAPNPVAQGSQITSTITVTNLGPQDVPVGGTITVTETATAGQEDLVSASGAGWTCGAPVGNAITCTRPGPLALNASAPAITVLSTATAAGTLPNTANVALSGPVADNVPGNNGAGASTVSTVTTADLTIAKSVDLATVTTAQNTLTYTLTVTNNGPDPSTNVTVTDPVPMFTSSALHGTTGIVATPSQGSCSVNGSNGTVTCNLGTLASGASATITVAVSRPMLDGPFTNTATVTSPDIGDPGPALNSASAGTTVQPVTDVEMTSKSATPSSPLAGTNSTYVLNFRNNGPSTATGVTVQDVFTVPPGDSGFTVISAGCSKGGCACMFSAGVPGGTFGSFNCNVGSMASAETASATFVIRPNFQTGNPARTFNNTATIATTTAENNAANNAKSVALSVGPALIDLVVNKIDLADPVGFDTPVNTFIDYRISVSNGGPSYASGIQVTDTMTTAAGKSLEFIGLQATTCSVPAAPTCAGGGTTFTGTQGFACGAFELAATASCTLDLRFRVLDQPPITGDTYIDLASVTANEPDSILANSSESESTTVRVRSDLQAVSKTASINPVNLNEPFNWTIVIRNNGPGDSEFTTVTDTLPAGMQLFGAAPSYLKTGSATSDGSGNCSVSGSTITCAMGRLDANPPTSAIATITVPVRVTAFPAGGMTANSATAATNQVDFNAANNSVTGNLTVRKSSIAGRVYSDNNANGAFNALEGIDGVTLTLTGTDLYGNAISRMVTTASDGLWTFDNLPPSNGVGYQIVETQPAGFFDSKEVAPIGGGAVPAACPPAANCGNGAAQNTISGIVLAPNTSATGYFFEEYAAATVSGFVYHDVNNNGQRAGAGETGIAGVTVTLTGTDYAGNPVSLSAVTNGSGQYTFTGNVPRPDAGGYTLTETLPEPAGFLDGLEQNGAGAGNVIAGSSNRPAPDTITLTQAQVAPGGNLAERNFGELQTSTLTGAVYADENGNGARDVGETVGIPGVIVTLTGTNDIGQAVNCQVATIASGVYNFPNAGDANPVCRSIRPGTYTVTETKPAGLTSTGAQAGSLGGTTGADATTQFVQNIVIANSATALTGYNFGHQGTLLGGSVYVDTNNNGVRDPGEPGIPGVDVTLSGNTAGNVNVCTVFTCTVTTDAAGNYSFANVPGSDATGYTIRETGAGGAPSPLLAAFVDGTDRAGTVSGAPVGSAGNDQISSVVIAIGQIGAGYTFGERGQVLSGAVYGDNNHDGLRQAGEPGLPGVTITLSGLTSTGVNVCTIVPSCVVVTDASGNYAFDNLPSGTYTLTETQPAGYLDGRETAGTLGGTVDNGSFTANPAQNAISGIVLGIGQSGTGYSFGEQTAKVRGSVYQDANGSGVRDPGEVGIAGVTITLTGTDNLGNPVNRTTLTDATGDFLFDGLRQGTYAVAETHPVIYLDGLDRVGTISGLPVGTAGNDLITGIVLGAGDDAVGYQFGEQVLTDATLRGRVWFDADHDRLDNDGPGSGRANWIAELVRGGVTVLSARSDANGDYLFPSVPPNTGYQIRFRNPANNAVFGSPRVEAPNLVPGSVVANGTINDLTIISGANIVGQNLPLDPNGVVYHSITRVPVAGATVVFSGPAGFDPAVHLLGGTGNVSQTVGADGFYQYLLLPGAPAGVYRLAVTSPPGLLPAPSALIGPCSNTLAVVAAPDPALVQTSNLAPVAGSPIHAPGACPASSAALAGSAGTTQYYLSFVLTPGVSANLVNNHIALDPVLGGAITVQKTTPLVNVTRGDLVPYTITATNNLAVTLPNIDLRDQIPPGFRYRGGSASLNGVGLEPVSSGRNLLWSNLTFTPNERKTFRMLLIVGTGVGEGEYVNQAWAMNNIANLPVSNVATAAVRVVPDPTFDCTDVIGMVFDDRNANGSHDAGERGIANVRVATARGLLVTTDAEGRFSVPCALVPNPDRGSNFVIKLDARTLPSGYRTTTPNPRDVRATRGKMVRLDFGAAVHRVVRIEMFGAAFEAQGEALQPAWRERFAALPGSLKAAPSVVLLSYRESGEPEDLVERRIKALADALAALWREQGGAYRLEIEAERVR